MDFCVWRSEHDQPKIAEPIPIEIKDFDKIENMPSYCIEFLNVDKYELSDLMMAAIDLELDSIRDLIGAKIALILRGMSVQEVRDWYEFTPEEIGFTQEEEELNKEELEAAKAAYGDQWMNRD